MHHNRAPMFLDRRVTLISANRAILNGDDGDE
jgi:hypothetical protein